VNSKGNTESKWQIHLSSKWLVFKRPEVAGFERPLTQNGRGDEKRSAVQNPLPQHLLRDSGNVRIGN
jgi:hypothetical protein